MSITQKELAERIRRARVAAGLTQDDLARVLGLSRSAVAQIEAGNRKVDSIELARIARFLGRAAGDFLAPEFREDGVAVVLRALAEARQDPGVQEELSRALAIARQIVALEEVLGLTRLRPTLPHYGEPLPASVWEAVVQGERLAKQERQRLQLGIDPIGDLAGLLESHGVLVLEVALPDAVSGFTFRFGKDLACGVNVNHHPGRRRYSLAHELCHALCDVGPADGIVTYEGGKDPRETRANAFAAAFLMPEEGVRAVLAGLGKGHPAAVATEAGPVRRRSPAGRIDLGDVVELARYFGVTREAAIWRLKSLRLIDETEREELAALAKSGLGSILERRLDAVEGGRGPDNEAPLRYGERRLLRLAWEALAREEISRRKFVELAQLAGLSEEEIHKIPLARRSYETRG